MHAFNNIFLFVRTDLSYCISLKAAVKVSYETMCMEPLVSVYIAQKIHQNY